jgi:hypothetical protein
VPFGGLSIQGAFCHLIGRGLRAVRQHSPYFLNICTVKRVFNRLASIFCLFPNAIAPEIGGKTTSGILTDLHIWEIVEGT